MDEDIYKALSELKDNTGKVMREETSKLHDSIKEIREISIETRTYQKANAKRLDDHIEESKGVRLDVSENTSFRKATKWLIGGSYAALVGVFGKIFHG